MERYRIRGIKNGLNRRNQREMDKWMARKEKLGDELMSEKKTYKRKRKLVKKRVNE